MGQQLMQLVRALGPQQLLLLLAELQEVSRAHSSNNSKKVLRHPCSSRRAFCVQAASVCQACSLLPQLLLLLRPQDLILQQEPISAQVAALRLLMVIQLHHQQRSPCCA